MAVGVIDIGKEHGQRSGELSRSHPITPGRRHDLHSVADRCLRLRRAVALPSLSHRHAQRARLPLWWMPAADAWWT